MKDAIQILFGSFSVLLSTASLILALIAYRNTRRLRFRDDRRALIDLTIDVLKLYASTIGRLDAILVSAAYALAEEAALSNGVERLKSDSLIALLRRRVQELQNDAALLKKSTEEAAVPIKLASRAADANDVERFTAKLLDALSTAHRAAALADSKSWDAAIEAFKERVAKLTKESDDDA